MDTQDILLDSGTNEVEFLEFYLGKQSFGINVEKIKQILKYDESHITNLLNSYHSIIGSYLHQDLAVAIVDLNKHLSKKIDTSKEYIRISLICEFNNTTHGFLVDGVNNIIRVSWDQIKPVPKSIHVKNLRLTGILSVENREILLLDFEGIIEDIHPHKEIDIPIRKETNGVNRQNTTIYLAEDSPSARLLFKNILKQNNYTNVQFFENGADAYKAILNLDNKAIQESKDISDYLQILITDVEMPQMDGLTLCRKVKEKCPKLPVIIFSSLINTQMALKCKSVAADRYINKKNIGTLLEMIDELSTKNLPEK